MQMRKDRLQRRAASAKTAGLMQATPYAALEASPDSSSPLDIIEEADLGSHLEAVLEDDAPGTLEAPLLAAWDADDSAPASSEAAAMLQERSLPAQDASQVALDTASALPAAMSKEPVTPTKGTTAVAPADGLVPGDVTLLRHELITPMKGATAVDLADGNASEDPETWLIGAGSRGDAESSRGLMISAPASPQPPAALPGSHGLMEFSPNPHSPAGRAIQDAVDQPAMPVLTDAYIQSRDAGADASSESLDVVKKHLEGNIEAVMSAEVSTEQGPNIFQGQAPVSKHGISQRLPALGPISPRRLSSPGTLLVIDEDAREEALIGAHHSQRQGSPRKSPKKSESAQLLMVAESSRTALVGFHHASRQPLSPHKQGPQPQDGPKLGGPPDIVLSKAPASVPHLETQAKDEGNLEDAQRVTINADGESLAGKRAAAEQSGMMPQQDHDSLAGTLVGSNHGKRQPASPTKMSSRAHLNTESPVPQSAVQGTTVHGGGDSSAMAPPAAEQSAMMHQQDPNLFAGTLMGINHGKRQPASPTKESSREPLDTELSLPQPAVSTAPILDEEHNQAESLPLAAHADSESSLQAPDMPEIEMLAEEAMTANALTGRHHGKRQKSPKKAPKWLQRVLSISKPSAPSQADLQTADADPSPAAHPVSDVAQSAGIGPEPSPPASQHVPSGTPEDASPITRDDQSASEPVREQSAGSLDLAQPDAASDMGAMGASDVEPDQSANASAGTTSIASPRKPSQLTRKGSRMLRTVLSGLTGKPRRASKQDMASDPGYSTIPEESVGSEMSQSAREASSEVALAPRDMMQATREATAYHAMQAANMQGHVSPDSPAETAFGKEEHVADSQQTTAVSPVRVQRRTSSATSLQIDDLLTDTPFRASPSKSIMRTAGSPPITPAAMQNQPPTSAHRDAFQMVLEDDEDQASPSGQEDPAGSELASERVASVMQHPLASLQIDELLGGPLLSGDLPPDSATDDAISDGITSLTPASPAAASGLEDATQAAVTATIPAASSGAAAVEARRMTLHDGPQQHEVMQAGQAGLSSGDLDVGLAAGLSVQARLENGEGGFRDVTGEIGSDVAGSSDDDLDVHAADMALPDVPSSPLVAAQNASE